MSHTHTHTTQARARLLITGARDYTNEASIRCAFVAAENLLSPHGAITLVHGGARGADTVCAHLAHPNWAVEEHLAQWNTHTAACPQWHHSNATCRMAGHRRNHEMIALGADLVLGFPTGSRSSGLSRGTWGAIAAAVAAELPTLIVWHNQFFWANNAGRSLIAGHVAEHVTGHVTGHAELQHALPSTANAVAIADIHQRERTRYGHHFAHLLCPIQLIKHVTAPLGVRQKDPRHSPAALSARQARAGHAPPPQRGLTISESLAILVLCAIFTLSALITLRMRP